MVFLKVDYEQICRRHKGMKYFPGGNELVTHYFSRKMKRVIILLFGSAHKILVLNAYSRNLQLFGCWVNFCFCCCLLFFSKLTFQITLSGRPPGVKLDPDQDMSVLIRVQVISTRQKSSPARIAKEIFKCQC